MIFDLILIGFGQVARRFVTLLDEQRRALARDEDLDVRIIGIATRRQGQMFSHHGINPASYASSEVRLESDATDPSVAFIRHATRQSAAAARQRRLVVVEATTLDIARGEPAISHVRAALAGGAHVVTVNKGPAAFAYRALARAAARADRRFLFEGAVMDGMPIFNLVRETLPQVRMLGFRGVVNATTNYMLTAMEQGRPFDDALREMQARGIAEADASLDVDGWDAAAKTSALANVLLGATLTPRDVAREGIARDMAARAVSARRSGRRLKLVARARRERARVDARVSPEELPGDDLLAGLEGQQNAIILDTDLLGEIAIVQRGGSLTQTAYALLSDLVTIARDVRNARATRRSQPAARRHRTL